MHNPLRILILFAILGVFATPTNLAHAQSPALAVTITTPLEKETLYASIYSLVYSMDIAGFVVTSNPEPTLIQVRLDVISEGRIVTTTTSRLHPDGSFAFGMTINPDAPAGQFSADQRNCDACHYLADVVLPQGQVTLRVTAREPNGNQATAERHIVVDHSRYANVPVKIVSAENPAQPIAQIPVYGLARMYLWRTRIGLATTDVNGQAQVRVEALSQAPTRIVFDVPPVVVAGVLYESVEAKTVTLKPGQAQSEPITLQVRARRGQVTGTLQGAGDAPLTVRAIDALTGATFVTQARANTFGFTDLPVAEYFIALDPGELALRALQVKSSQVDLTTAPLAQTSIVLSARPASSRVVSGTIRTPGGEPASFAWIGLDDMPIARTNPATGEFVLYDVPADARTLRVIAPGFWSQRIALDNDAPISVTLAPRDELRAIAWGNGRLWIPSETVTESSGGRLVLTHGWMWGQGTGNFSLRVEDATITLTDARVAIERQAERVLVYVLAGKANVAFDTLRSSEVIAGQMLVIDARSKDPGAVAMDALAIHALTAPFIAPSEFVIAPTLDAQASELVARLGISVAQLVTFATYLFITLALGLTPVVMGVLWRRFRR